MQQTHWQQQGQEPDYRFSLANERTFLAWMRTALALLAAGVLLYEFASSVNGTGRWIGVGLAALSGVVAWMAYLRWRANEIAMRHARPLPRTATLAAAAAMIAALALAAATLIAFHAR
jgi:putative membrane protein